ncbi:MAG: 2-C-methyl-D-erythritol 2,4-cyclodiphosphate synthase [Actinomycetota bacterium]
MAESRVGLGFDSHPRDAGRKLRLGGLDFGDEPGLAAHSDGDVVCHALADALLGAAALGDIGQHFPDDDPGFADMPGVDLLGRVVVLLEEAGFVPIACDLVVVADRPRFADRREEMRGRLAEVLGVAPAGVSVKATRAEGLGLTGDGIGCMALATIRPG